MHLVDNFTGGRQRAACCTVNTAPPPPSFCTADLCTVIPGFCANDDASISKRDVLSNGTELHELWEREKGGQQYPAYYYGAIFVTIIAQTYPSGGNLFGIRQASQVLRYVWRTALGACVTRSVNQNPVAAGPHPPGSENIDSEHVIDVRTPDDTKLMT